MSRDRDNLDVHLDELTLTAQSLEIRIAVFGLSEEAEDCVLLKSSDSTHLIYRKENDIRIIGDDGNVAWKEIREIDWEDDPVRELLGEKIRDVVMSVRPITDVAVRRILRKLPEYDQTTLAE